MLVRTRAGGVGVAVGWEAGVVAMARDLMYAMGKGDIGAVRGLIEVINSWACGNEEERRAYRVFTRVNPYRKLYETARRLVLT